MAGAWKIRRSIHPDCLAVISNLATLYTFLVPNEVESSALAIGDYFLMRLGFSVANIDSSIELPTKPELQFVTGNPRRVVGSMNDMLHFLHNVGEDLPGEGQ